ncbi:SAM-dependent methyltransferase [Halomontanus rarus]|uniref:SAM-dependent methyltransferase n=1 Tax=Halomontanus rarus TaxID=3034020 RepID=UPI001A99C34A
MSRKDHYYNKAKQEGYRSRAAYKLQQLDDLENVISSGDTVVDLGAAPGGWLQVAAERVGPQGRVIGVDLQRIKDLEDDTLADRVETIRGDMTEERTRERVIEAADGKVDCVLSDMAPNMSGEYSLDQARSLYLARMAFETAVELLDTDGDFLVKVFQGPDVEDLRSDVEAEFQYVRATSPKASRQESSEIYFIAKGRLTTPVRAGDELEVEIVDVGNEGDGIASVDGYRLFVPSTEEGEIVSVRVEDVKPRFGFAQRIDRDDDVDTGGETNMNADADTDTDTNA